MIPTKTIRSAIGRSSMFYKERKDIIIPSPDSMLSDCRINTVNLLSEFYDYASPAFIKAYQRFAKDMPGDSASIIHKFMESKGYFLAAVYRTADFDNDYSSDFEMDVYTKESHADYVYPPQDYYEDYPSLIVVLWPKVCSYNSIYNSQPSRIGKHLFVIPSDNYGYSVPIWDTYKVNYYVECDDMETFLRFMDMPPNDGNNYIYSEDSITYNFEYVDGHDSRRAGYFLMENYEGFKIKVYPTKDGR